MRRHWKKILVVSGIVVLALAVVAVSVVILYKIQDEDLRNILVPIIASVYGGLLTLVGVACTIYWTKKDTERRQKNAIKPIPVCVLKKGMTAVNTPSSDARKVFYFCDEVERDKDLSYTFKNIGEKPFEVCPKLNRDGNNWVLPNSEFCIAIKPVNTRDKIQCPIKDIMGNEYVYEITFDDIFSIDTFKCIKGE